MMDASSSDPSFKTEGGGSGDALEAANDQLLLYRGLKKAKKERGSTAKERISKMPPCAAGKRSSIYRGVTRHRWTGRYEAHLWDKSTWNQNQNKKGKQVYLGAYDDEEAAARAYDLAALKYWGPGTLINFPVTDYTRDLEEMQSVSREEYLASLRRKSSGFSRGISKYRGLSSRWEPSYGRGAEYLNNMHYGVGDDATTNSEFAGGFCVERKIDLTSYIKWWGPNRSRLAECTSKSSVETKDVTEDISSELKTLESANKPTEPYQMPQLGISHDKGKSKGSSMSALSILSCSAAYKSLQEKISKQKETITGNDEDENKSNISKIYYGKGIANVPEHEPGSETIAVAPAVVEGSNLQRPGYSLGQVLSAPLLTSYNIDSLTEHSLWSSMVPTLPSGLAQTSEATKTEACCSPYMFFQQHE